MNLRKRRVLVLDDEPLLQGALVRILSAFEVTVCSTVAEARALLLGEHFDAIVSDVELADGCGVALFEDVARARPEQRGRYVFVTGAVDKPKVRARLERTGAPFLAKPFVVRALLDLLAAIMATGDAVAVDV